MKGAKEESINGVEGLEREGAMEGEREGGKDRSREGGREGLREEGKAQETCLPYDGQSRTVSDEDVHCKALVKWWVLASWLNTADPRVLQTQEKNKRAERRYSDQKFTINGKHNFS